MAELRHPVTISLRGDTLAEARLAAEHEGRSLSNYIQRLLEMDLPTRGMLLQASNPPLVAALAAGGNGDGKEGA